jgi:predicted nucleic acid-binding protein
MENFVLDETFTLLGRRAGYDFAAQRARNIYASEWLAILRSEKNDELRAIDFFEKYSDHRLSFTDCISFVLMQRKKIKKVFTFDHHFQIFGFQIYPKKISIQ